MLKEKTEKRRWKSEWSVTCRHPRFMRDLKGEKQFGEPTSEVRLTQSDATGFPEKPCLIDPFLFTRDFCFIRCVAPPAVCIPDMQYTAMSVWVFENSTPCEASEKGGDCVCSCSIEGVLRHLPLITPRVSFGRILNSISILLPGGVSRVLSPQRSAAVVHSAVHDASVLHSARNKPGCRWP